MMKTLNVMGPQTGKRILELTAENGHVSLVYASSDEVREEILSMLRDGLIDWSTDENGTIQHISTESDEDFLEKLAGVLLREFSFISEIKVIETLQGGRPVHADNRLTQIIHPHSAEGEDNTAPRVSAIREQPDRVHPCQGGSSSQPARVPAPAQHFSYVDNPPLSQRPVRHIEQEVPCT